MSEDYAEPRKFKSIRQKVRRARLKVFFCPAIDQSESPDQVLERVGDAEAEIAFSVRAEGSAGEAGAAGLCEQRVGQFLRRPAGLSNVGEGVERAFRHEAGKAFDLFQAGDEDVAAVSELSVHLVDRGLIAAQRFDSGHLREAGGTGIRVGHEARDVRGQGGTHYAVAHAPSGHGVGFREAVEDDGPLLEAGDAHDGEVLAFVDKAAVDFVRKNHDVAVADGIGYFENVLFGEHAAGRVVRRVQDDQLGTVGDQRGQFFDIDGKVALLAQRNCDRASADIVDHGLIDGEAGIGVNDFIPCLNQRQDRKENNWLAARNNNDLIARHRDLAGAADIIGNGLAQVGQTGGGAVVGPSLVERVDTGLDDIGGSVEVGLANFEVNDFFALFFEHAGAVQDFKSGFRSEPRHPAGKTRFELGCGGHGGR